MYQEDPQILFYGLNESDYENYLRNKVAYNQRFSSIQAEARLNAKLDHCYYCKREEPSFCHSHSVPKFCLKRIAVDGKLYYLNTFIDFPCMHKDQGIGEAGTFKIICKKCDNEIFQQYEDPAVYQSKPTGQILAQIAMKNYLQMIYKRHYEKALYSLLGTQMSAPQAFVEYHHNIISLDLAAYEKAFSRAQRGSSGNHNDWYYLCYYQKLDYTVPIAFQGGVVIISDFEDNVINDIYFLNSDYDIKEIHIAVFPLEHESIIMMFLDTKDNRYRKFCKQLKKLSLEEQLSAINYIIFSYSENVFVSKSIDKNIITNERFISTCKKSTSTLATHPFGNNLHAAIKEFSLSKRTEIPNLLSRDFCLL